MRGIEEGRRRYAPGGGTRTNHFLEVQLPLSAEPGSFHPQNYMKLVSEAVD